MWIIGWLVSLILTVILSKFYYQNGLKNQIDELTHQKDEQINLLQTDLTEKDTLITKDLNKQKEQVSTYLKLISETLEDSANNADATSVELEQVISLIAELTGSLHNINDLTSSINLVVEQGGDAVCTVNKCLADTFSLGEDLESIRDKFEDITSITKDISRIGADAEMLALNAAIEAARAGDAGRGFSVVAENMKALAINSQSSTQKVLNVVNDSENVIQHVVSDFNSRGETLNKLVANLVSHFEKIDVAFTSIHQRSSNAEHSSEATSDSIQRVSSHIKTTVEALIQRLSKLVSTLTGKEVVDLTPQQVKEKWEQFDEIIDVRREKEWNDELGHLAGVTLSTLQTDFKQHVKSLSPSKSYLFICRSGGRSTKAAQMAITNGVTSVYNLDGGMLKWRATGY